MANIAQPQRPAWQTEELEDEWIDLDDSEDEDQPTTTTPNALDRSDVSFTESIGSLIAPNDSRDDSRETDSGDSAGTFIVREDVPAEPLLPQTPGRKMLGKDFFSPLALEKMFEPPSPPKPSTSSAPHTAAPVIPSRLSQMYIPGDESSIDTNPFDHHDGGFSSLVERTEQEERQEEETGSCAEESRDEEDQKYQFTFAAPQHPSFNYAANLFPNAQSTPGPARTPSRTVGGLAPPLTDPRLRLFQFQYDTFTREHLSAMVDSIAVNTPSGGSGTTLSKEATPTNTSSNTSISRLRSAKRIKLSPASDFSERGDGAALIMRPNSRRDYVGESKSLMEKIRQARDYSTISTQGLSTPGSKGKPAAEPQNDVEEGQHLNVPRATGTASSTWTSSSSKNGPYSSVAIREQAASLMNQIRSDVKSHKRLFSVESEGQAAESSQRALQAATEHLAQLAAEVEGQPVYEGDTELISDEDSTERGIPIGSNVPTASTTNWRPPRTYHRRSPADETNDELDDGLAQMSLEGDEPLTRIAAPVFTEPTPQPLSSGPAQQSDGRVAFLSPHGGASPVYPSSSIRGGRNEDLTRFVSSSTASGGTVASGSTASFVKHQGPKHMTHISPNDIPPMPERVGKMVFDRETMKWVKTESSGPATRPSGTMRTDGSNESEDPFKDIESLRDESPTRDGADADGQDADDGDKSDDMSLDKSRLDVQDESEPEDAEEAELVSFSFDGASAELPAVRVQLPSTIDSETEEEDEEPERDEQDTATTAPTASTNHLDDSIFSNDDSQTAQLPLPTEPAFEDTPPHMLAPASGQVSTPQPSSRLSHADAATPIIRSALKSGSATPLSPSKGASRNVLQTPMNKLSHRRSVSFSDGKRDGPIRGLGRKLYTPDGTVDTDTGSLSDGGLSEHGAALIPSARSKRIAEMLEGLGESDTSYDPGSPSKGSGRQSGDEIQAFGAGRGGGGSLGNASSREMSRRRMFSQSLSGRSPKAGGRNATFLTECSFGVAHDRLVQVITDVQPFEPYWDQLAAVDLGGKNLDSVARLKEFLPRLDSLTLNSNQIAYLSGVPGTVRTLSIASNCLTAVTSFSHLLNLESLDISRNSIDSLRQLECLRHLRELRADGNMIDSIDGLEKMDGLVKLSLQGNALHTVDVTGFRWARLEMLNMSHNRLGSLVGLAALPALIALNLDHNQLPSLVAGGPMPRLRILRVSANRLQELDAGPFPNLRTLYADNNALGPLLKAHRLAKLENLSLRNQGGRTGLSLALRDVRDVKRLYLSGNPLEAGFISEACYNLVYLELAACRLTALPRDFARLAPNLRVLNLNYNFLEDVRPLEGLVRLRRVTVIGSRVPATRQFVRVLRGLADAEMVDFRMSPCTLGWYLPLLLKDVPGAKAAPPRSTPAGPSWKELDAKFRRDLPDEAYVGRLAYRGLVMRACPALRILDGVEVSEKERDKAERLLASLAEAKRTRRPPQQQLQQQQRAPQ